MIRKRIRNRKHPSKMKRRIIPSSRKTKEKKKKKPERKRQKKIRQKKLGVSRQPIFY